MTRLVCIGDCHFGPQGGRNADRYCAFDQIVSYGLALEHLGAWLLAGDLNHAKMTIEDRNALATRLQTMANRAPVLMVRGNHDAENDLEIFTRLEAAHAIQLATAPRVYELALATGQRAAVACLPYVFKGPLVGAGVGPAALGQAARDHFDAILLSLANDLAIARSFGAFTVLLGHLNIGGAVSSVGQPQVGQDIELDSALLARVPPTVPKIFGHIHKHQHIHGAWYLGSIARMDFGEQEGKVFGVLSFETPDDYELEFLPIAVPGQHHVDGRLTREAFTIIAIDGDLVTELPAQESWRGTDIRARYAFNPAEITALDVAKIHAEFAGCRSLKIEPVPDRAVEIRAPEIAAATTLEAKVEAFCARSGLAWSAGVLAKLTALQTQEREALLSAVASAAQDAGAVNLTEAATPERVEA